jgi:Fe-S oxidoreductase
MSPVGELGASGYAVFWGVTLLASGIFSFRIYKLLRYLSLGKSGLGIGHAVKRTLTATGHVIGQWCQFKNFSLKDRATLGHVFMAWGFLIFAIYYLLFIIIGEGFGIEEVIEKNSFYAYYSWIMDIVAPFIIIGAAWGIIRRYVIKPPRLKGQQTFEAMLILVTVLIHPITHLFKIATGIALGNPPAGLGIALPPISAWLSQLFTGSSVVAWHVFFFWTHWGFVLFVMGIIGYTRYLHMVVAPFNVFLRSAPPKGALSPINLESAETFGVSKITDFTWKQLLDLSGDSDVDVVYWVGCTAALDERCQKIAVSMAKILRATGVKFAILGNEESCCGDPARRAGNEYLFQMQAERNIETLKRYNVKKIVTACPHCFNTLKNEYPQFGGDFEVMHHTQFIADLLSQGKLRLVSDGSRKVTYHDPCYLGRYNDVYDEPRKILASIPKLRLAEMDRIKRDSFCCGGGGGRSWMEEPGTKISHLRTDDVIKTGADILALACPFCVIMFEDAVKSKGVEEKLKVMDIAELVAQTIAN